MPNFLRAANGPATPTPGRRGAAVVQLAATATATALLLSGCDISGAARDVAAEFGNARQVSEEPSVAVPEGEGAGEGDELASASPSPSPDPLPSYAETTVVGDYAPGFPPDLLPTPKGTELLATSAEPVEGSKPPTVQVTLNLSAEKGPGKLMGQVAGILKKNGFEPVDAPEKNGMNEQLAFTRTTTVADADVAESLLVGVLKADKRSLLTLSGTVAAAGGKDTKK